MKRLIAALVGSLLALFPVVAHAGGSDSPTPYTVDTAGVTLPDGQTFAAHGHVNVKFLLKDGSTTNSNIHFDPNNNHPGGHWIGRSFVPWTAWEHGNPSVNPDDIACITWVQMSDYNEHYGEGGQGPLCIQKPPAGPPSDSEERVRDTTVNCEERIVNWVKESRDAIFDYDWTEPGWVQTGWTDWVEIDSGFRNEKADQCDDIPVVGSELNAWLLGGGVLLLIAGVGIARIGRV